ncbi:MAG: quinolinate synthase NadA [Candidatus Azobacteroides pseudotrichonymphae]|jgi:quinolinate synthase|nr:MAG: quinolinate synthase NadA [Candidatus Azobacteroides pseudotrichonymphae]
MINNLSLIQSICDLKRKKNAIILSHYYQNNSIQEIADYVGDSLALARLASQTNADVIILCGVHFMAETAKILSPKKRVFIPDINARCSLADSCPLSEFKEFIKQYPYHLIVSYINTSVEIKVLTDIVVTSGNACKIIESFPKNVKLIFAPDRNLGNYINSITGRDMILWNGACHVHEQFSLEKILNLKQKYPNALVLAHPECKSAILKIADYIASTAGLLNYVSQSKRNKFIVATESGILHKMKMINPDKFFIPAPPNDSTCACNECSFMRLNTLEKLHNCLKYEEPEIIIDRETIKKAAEPINKMLKLSDKLGL